jgi:hypothetical protein
MASTVSTEFVNYASLPPGSCVDVETRNRHYVIECLGGDDMRISGHPEYCPTPVPAKLHGAATKYGVTEPGMIGRGQCLQFVLEGDRPILTTRVLSVQVRRPV